MKKMNVRGALPPRKGRTGRSSDTLVKSGPRKPQTEQGQQRVNAILEAATALIAEEGLSALTVENLVSRASTSMGSLYHFFPNIDAVNAALADLYRRGLESVIAQLQSKKKAEWLEMSTTEIVDHILAPFWKYYAANPWVEVLRAAPKEGKCLLDIEKEWEVESIRLLSVFLSAPNAGFSPRLRRVRTLAFMTIAIGMVTLMGRSSRYRDEMIPELKKALVAYLDKKE